MKASLSTLFLLLSLVLSSLVYLSTGVLGIHDPGGGGDGNRRILHQPLFPVDTTPPPAGEPPPPAFAGPDEPFFPEVPNGQSPDQTQNSPPSPPADVSIPVSPATAVKPSSPTKKVAIGVSVGIVTLGMISAFGFFLYRHRVRHRPESQKLVGGDPNSQRLAQEPTGPASDFLYLGTMEPSDRRGGDAVVEEANGISASPYHKLSSNQVSDLHRPSPELLPLSSTRVSELHRPSPELHPLSSMRMSQLHRPSPELHPLSPLTRPPQRKTSLGLPPSPAPPPPAMSSDDETFFYTPQGSVAGNGSSNGNGESPCEPASRQVWPKISSRENNVTKSPSFGTSSMTSNSSTSTPQSRRSSPKSRFSISSSPEVKRPVISSVPPPPPPPPLNPRPSQQLKDAVNPPPVNDSSRETSKSPVPPPPPPPPRAPPAMLTKVLPSETNTQVKSVRAFPRTEPQMSSPSVTSSQKAASVSEVNQSGGSSSEKINGEGDTDALNKPKLKPLHWDKVRATSDRAMVWDHLKSSSFQVNEDMIESLFGCNNTNTVHKEATRRSVLPSMERENRVLDPKKSQNIAILLRALNVTRDEVCEAILDGNPEALGAELLETLVKMAPTKEEELKLRDYSGDISKLGSAERFLKAVLDIPFSFKRVDAMLYRANFETEVKYLRKSFQTLEAACEELKNSRLFLKLLEAVLRTGNRMNVGTNRGEARAFKLDTLLKLVDIKGTDGKTTLLHFVVQEITKSEGAGSDPPLENPSNKMHQKVEDDFRKQGLQVVAGLGRELGNVKKAAGMDSDVLSSYVSKLESGLDKVRLVLQYEKSNTQGKFFEVMKHFLNEAEEEIRGVKDDERKVLCLVKEVTDYFHGDAAKEEAHPFRIFVIVRDFLTVLDQVCKEVGKMQDRTTVGSTRSFRISANASLPVLNRFNIRQQHESSDEESSSSP